MSGLYDGVLGAVCVAVCYLSLYDCILGAVCVAVSSVYDGMMVYLVLHVLQSVKSI